MTHELGSSPSSREERVSPNYWKGKVFKGEKGAEKGNYYQRIIGHLPRGSGRVSWVGYSLVLTR